MAKDHAITYEVSVSGLWTPVHSIRVAGEGEIGRMTVSRNKWSLIMGAKYSPEKGEQLSIRRDPGLLRGQFSLWTERDQPEWLGSALRPSFFMRGIDIHTGSRPMRLYPLEGLRTGWTLQAPKTGEMARVIGNPITRNARIEVFRRLEFETVLFAYFLGSMVMKEALLPGPHIEAPAPPPAKRKKAAATA